MEFIDFLDRAEVKIINIIEKVGYQIEENTKLCLLSKNYMGFLKRKKKVVIICTKNAKKREGYTILRKNNKDAYERTALHIKKALRHEAVHIAQECNDGNLLNIKEKFSMRPSKIKALNESMKISGEREREREREREAYILEDRPKLVEKELKKYCL